MEPEQWTDFENAEPLPNAEETGQRPDEALQDAPNAHAVVDKTEEFLQQLEKKLTVIPVVGNDLASIPLMISLVRSYSKKEYPQMPIGSVIAMAGGLLYLLAPVDLIPDVILVAGIVDDAVALKLVFTLVESDLAEYAEWQRKNGRRVVQVDRKPIRVPTLPWKKKDGK